MKVWNQVVPLCLFAGLFTVGMADNPISTYHYLADPGAAADDDRFGDAAADSHSAGP